MKFVSWQPVEEIFAAVRAYAASSDPVTAACGRMLLKLVEYLQSRGPIPKAGVMFFENRLMINLYHPSRSVSVWGDWNDYSEMRGGLPVMHYRLQITKPDSVLSENKRVATLVEAACAILSA